MKTQESTSRGTGGGGNKSRRRLLAVLGLSAGIATTAAVWPDRGRVDAPAHSQRVLAVSTVMASQRDSYQVESRFVGRVEAARSSELGFELAGTLVRLHVDEGERVEAGQLLAELDTTRLQARRAELAAAAEEARANQNLAAVTFKRTGRLVESGAVSKQRLDEAKRELAVADSVLERIEAQLSSLEVNFAKSQLRGPYSGVVVARHVDEGSVLTPGVGIIRILESSRLQMRVGVTPSAAKNLELGEEVQLTDQRGIRFPATVSAVLPERRETTRTIDVVLVPAGKVPTLRDGDLVQIGMPREVDVSGYWLPRSALTESVRGLWAVYALQPDERGDGWILERRQIEIIHQDANRLFVRGALADGEQIAAGGLHRLVAGQRVYPLSSTVAQNSSTEGN